MKICDRCSPNLVPSVEVFVQSVEGTQIDLCQKCTNEVLNFIHHPPEPERRSILGLGKRKKDTHVEM